MQSFLRRPARVLAALCLLASLTAQAAYPTRPITFIVPWGAGGGTDAVARMLGTLLERDLGQPVNVVNRTGGNGVVGHAAIASARPDGYTIGMITRRDRHDASPGSHDRCPEPRSRRSR